MNSPDLTYRVERQDPEQAREAVLALWKASGFGPQETPDAARNRYNWLHLQNPAGPSRIYVLKDAASHQVVGSVGACNRVFVSNGGITRGTLLVDFVVDPAHRSLFPALMLQRAVREQELAANGLIYAIPEPKAVPVFKRLGADLVTRCRRFARVVRFRHVANKFLWAPLAALAGALIDLCDFGATAVRLRATNLAGSWVTGFGPDIDRLWTVAKASAVPLGERSPQFLNWRFFDCPGQPPRVFLVQDRKSGEPRAYFVCAQNGETALIKDFFSIGTPAELVHALLLFSRAVRGLGASVIYLDFAGSEATEAALRTTHFVQRNERQCFVKAEAAGRAPQWLTCADEDV